MQLTLLLPGLLWPRQALVDTVFDLAAPALSLILGRARIARLPAAPVHDWLVSAWGLEGMPLAALRLLGEGGQPANGHWLCLDPVHLRLEEWSLVADDPMHLALTAEEDAALRAALAPLFADWGALTALTPGRWYLACDPAPALTTSPLQEAIGRPADPALPGGDQGAAWRRRLAEAQTLLHDHPVNTAREEAGRPPVNSLWPWGEGRLGGTAASPWQAVYGDDPVLAGLAALSAVAREPLPPGFQPPSGHGLALVDDLAAPCRAHDALAWREALLQVDGRWLAPALAALKTGRLEQLRLVAFGSDSVLDMDLRRGDTWRFWRRPRPLTDLAP
jgi:hypothetical protein